MRVLDLTSRWRWVLGALAWTTLVVAALQFCFYPYDRAFPYRSYTLGVALAAITLGFLHAPTAWQRMRRSARVRRVLAVLVALLLSSAAGVWGWAWTRVSALRTTHDAAVPTPVSATFLQATVLMEDPEFFHHHGFDLVGIHRAVRRNLHERRLVQGGSTLTQQLAKNTFLGPDRTFWRKAKEAILSTVLEARFDKTEILDEYVRGIDYGMGQHGIDAAARYYFHHGADTLDLAESAVLVGMVSRPPRRWLDETTLRSARQQVLGRLAALGAETFPAAAIDAAKAIPLEHLVPAYLGPRERGAIGNVPGEGPHVLFVYGLDTTQTPATIWRVAPRLADAVLEFARESYFVHDVRVIEHLGVYNDRLVRGSERTVSAHAFGQAFDLSAFHFADGSRLAVVDHANPVVAAKLSELEATLRMYCDELVTWRSEPIHHQDHYHCEIHAPRPGLEALGGPLE